MARSRKLDDSSEHDSCDYEDVMKLFVSDNEFDKDNFSGFSNTDDM